MHLRRAGHLQPEKRIEHFRAVGAAVGEVSREDEMLGRPPERKAIENLAAIEFLQHLEKGADVAVEISDGNCGGVALQHQLHRERLEGDFFPAKPTAGGVEELRWIWRAVDPFVLLRDLALAFQREKSVEGRFE